MLSIGQYNSDFSVKYSNKKNVSFGSNYEMTYDSFLRTNVTKNATWFFRDDLPWKKFCDFILNHFKDSNKVNLISVPCSDGSEPISLLLKLKQFESFDNQKGKYLPIKAFDIDEKQLKIAESGIIPLFSDDPIKTVIDATSIFCNASKSLGRDYKIDKGHLILSDNLKDDIKYQKMHICDVLKNLSKTEDVVLLVRNVFPYLNDYTEIPVVLSELSKFKTGSVLAIGDFDTEKIPCMKRLLEKSGFKKTDMKNCYLKK